MSTAAVFSRMRISQYGSDRDKTIRCYNVCGIPDNGGGASVFALFF